MMDPKVAFQILIIALIVFMFTTHQAWGEQDCHNEKISVIRKCQKIIEIGTPYARPRGACRRAVESSDMACVCRIITEDEEFYISVSKIVQLARDCGKIIPEGAKCGSKYINCSSFI